MRDNYIILNIILFLSFTINTFFLEMIYKINNDCSQFLVLYSTICSYLTSLIFSYNEKLMKPIPKYKYLIISLSTFISSQSGLYALKYISISTRLLLKSCKSIPIVILQFTYGKNIPLHKLLSIILLSSGTYIYFYDENNSDSIYGLLLICISLLGDGFVGIYEDALVEKYKIKPFSLMKMIQLYRIILSILLIQNWIEFYSFINNNKIILLGLGVSGTTTQICIFVSLNKYGSLSTSMMGSMRKIINIILFIMINNVKLSSQKYIGLSIGISGIIINCIRNNNILNYKINSFPCKKYSKTSDIIFRMLTN